MSPGLVARPSGMFSAAATMATRLIFGRMPSTASTVPNTLAAPHMSNFISSMASPGLSEMPPVSKVMPLPTSTWGASSASSAPWYFITISREGCSLPRPTESRLWAPSVSRASSSRISTARAPPEAWPRASARSAR